MNHLFAHTDLEPARQGQPGRDARKTVRRWAWASLWLLMICVEAPSGDNATAPEAAPPVEFAPAPAPTPAPAPVESSLYTFPIRFDLRIGAWLPQTRSNQKAKNTADDRVNFHNLDVTPDNAFPQGDLAVTLFNLHRLRAEYWDSTSSGRTFLNRNITFNGTLFPSSSEVESTVEASALKLGYELLIIDVPELRLGIGGGAQIFSAKSQIKLTSGASKATRHDDRTVWFLTGDLAVDLAFLELFGVVDALSYNTAALFDGRAGAMLRFDLPPGSPVVSFGGGADWRVWDTRIDDEDVDGEWTMQGLELFVFARF